MAIDLDLRAPPAVNQIELHPLLNQDDLRKAHARSTTSSHSPTPRWLWAS